VKNLPYLKSFFKSWETSSVVFRRDLWTLEILRLLFIITALPAIIILFAIWSGFFTFSEAYPLFLDLLLLFIGWQGARRGGWQWAGLIPPVVSLLLGLYGLDRFGVNNTTILLFAASVVLAGMLQGNRTSLFFVIACTLAYSYVLYQSISVLSYRYFVSIMVVLVSLTGLMIIQWYFFKQLRETIESQIKTNQDLKDQIELRQKTEETLRVQDATLRRLTNYMTDMVAEMTMDGKYLYASPSYYTVLGYKPEELANINAFSLIYPEDLPFVQDSIKKVMETNLPTRARYRIKHADGHLVWLESNGRYLVDESKDSKTLIFSTREITRQKQAEDDNLASERKFRSIIEAIPLGIHIYSSNENDDLIFTGFNPAANRILGLEHDQFLGEKIQDAFPGLVGTDTIEQYNRVARKGEMWSNDQLFYLDGKITGAFEVHAFQISPGNMVALFSDITAEKQAQEALRLSEEKFSTAFRTSPDSININRMTDGMYMDINTGFTQMTGFTREDVIGKTSVEIDIWVNLADRVRLVEGLKRDGIYRNLQADFRAKDGHIIHGLMSASIIMVNGEECLLNITRDISERIRSEKALIEAHTHLEKAYDATLHGWARALEMREHETADHSRRVVEITERIAREMGLREEELLNIKRGALLHDIGKIGVPDNILLKPGPLTSDEWAIMRQHPEFAYRMLKDIDYLQSAIEIPYGHHERWDGSGYPRGLAGTDIPLAARIFSVVDVWDALLSDRPYRPAWDQKTVLNYLQEQSGKQFDPAVVEIIIRLLSDMN